MKNQLLSPDAVAELVRSGATMIIAGSEAALQGLPAGNWIGGTSHYFLSPEGGRKDDVNLMVTVIEDAADCLIRHVRYDALDKITDGRFDNGFSLILIPAFSDAHQNFALNGPELPGIFDQPLMGWITGTRLEDIGRVSPKVVDGSTGKVSQEGALLMHVELPAGQVAEIDILNLFTQSTDAAHSFVFDETGFSAGTAHVNGKEVNLADYIREHGFDTKLPLVADYAGAMVNVSFRDIDRSTGKVHFYAPVVAGVEYRLARPLEGDYASQFAAKATGDGSLQLSCNCILNYLYGELEGRTTGSYSGPATFGEIAYMLLNQTMVRVEVKAAEARSVA